MNKMGKQKVVPILMDTYLSSIENSVGSKIFRNVYAKVNGKKTNITRNGQLSCAFYVSSILLLFKLIKEIHVTVNSTVRDLEEFGWVEIKNPKIGSVIVWEEIDFGGNNFHRHAGFYVGEKIAISNNYKSGYPSKHDWKYKGKRKIELILWNPALKASGN